MGVGLNIKGFVCSDENAQVQIAAHRTVLKMLVNVSRSLNNLGVILLDEAHVDNASTVLLRKYARGLIDHGCQVVEYSATLHGQVNDASKKLKIPNVTYLKSVIRLFEINWILLFSLNININFKVN